MKILEINGLKYSKEEFKGYKFRGVFSFFTDKNEYTNINIYTTNQNQNEVLELLNKKKKEHVLKIEVYHWCTKEQDDRDTELLLSGW
ncbi:MAG: hypothetical protein GY849_02060, partial [Deltaproteobacteria bacterium]|nr:hypothetical protein [Deltaproteobacteria bacterium]